MLKFRYGDTDYNNVGCPDAKGSAAELEVLKTKVGYMYYFILIVIMISAGLTVIMADKYLELRKEKELYKSDVAWKISCISGVVAISLLFILSTCF